MYPSKYPPCKPVGFGGYSDSDGSVEGVGSFAQQSNRAPPCVLPVGFGYSDDVEPEEYSNRKSSKGGNAQSNKYPGMSRQFDYSNGKQGGHSTRRSPSWDDDNGEEDYRATTAATSSPTTTMWQVEALTEQNMRNEANLIDWDDQPKPQQSLDTSNNNDNDYQWINADNYYSENAGNDLAGSSPDRLPKKSICYDYIRQPIGIKERKCEFLPQQKRLISPFLRPILIDGLGLIKAYWEGCSDTDLEKTFSMVPIVRCLFYWIARGHLAQVFFPDHFSPITAPLDYGTTDQNVAELEMLEQVGMAKFFESDNHLNKELIVNKQEALRACLITSVAHYLSSMPSSLLHDFDYKTWTEVQMCSSYTLQPYFGSEGDLVFFSPIRGARREFVVDTVLDYDIRTAEQFHKLEPYQLSFINQAKQLKVLYDLLPANKRIREASVMIAVLERLEKFI